MSNKNNRKDYLYGDFGIKKCKSIRVGTRSWIKKARRQSRKRRKTAQLSGLRRSTRRIANLFESDNDLKDRLPFRRTWHSKVFKKIKRRSASNDNF